LNSIRSKSEIILWEILLFFVSFIFAEFIRFAAIIIDNFFHIFPDPLAILYHTSIKK
jgi:hypothetical protein